MVGGGSHCLTTTAHARAQVTALPQVPKGAGSFNEFHYAIDPYEHGEVSATIERSEMLTKRLFGPLRAFVPVMVGVLQMRQRVFQFANVSSAFVWVLAMLAPLPDDDLGWKETE